MANIKYINLGLSSPLVVSDSEPSNTDVLWLDGSSNPRTLKFHNGSRWLATRDTQLLTTFQEGANIQTSFPSVDFLQTVIRDHFTISDDTSDYFATQLNEDIKDRLRDLGTGGSIGGINSQIDALESKITSRFAELSGTPARYQVDKDGIQAGAVDTDQIKDDAVTNDKIPINAGIDGRKIASGIAGANIDDGSISNLKLLPGIDGSKITGDSIPGGSIGMNEITSRELKSNGSPTNRAVTTDTIEDDAVTTAKLRRIDGSEAVDTEVIRDNAVTGVKILDGEVTHLKLSSATGSGGTPDGMRAVGTNNIKDKNITGIKIANDDLIDDERAITQTHIKNNAVITRTIFDNAVTTAKLRRIDGSEAVDTEVIRNNAVTFVKLDSNVQSAINNNVTFSKEFFVSITGSNTSDISFVIDRTANGVSFYEGYFYRIPDSDSDSDSDSATPSSTNRNVVISVLIHKDDNGAIRGSGSVGVKNYQSVFIVVPTPPVITAYSLQDFVGITSGEGVVFYLRKVFGDDYITRVFVDVPGLPSEEVSPSFPL